MKERTQIFCHACGGYFTAEFDTDLNGNHVVACPKCQHEHCRVIENGKVTGDRWDQRNGNTYNYTASMSTYTTTSTYLGGDHFLSSAWAQTTGSGTTSSVYIW
jgi:hypothetical protein